MHNTYKIVKPSTGMIVDKALLKKMVVKFDLITRIVLDLQKHLADVAYDDENWNEQGYCESRENEEKDTYLDPFAPSANFNSEASE